MKNNYIEIIKLKFNRICSYSKNNSIEPAWVFGTIVAIAYALLKIALFSIESGKCGYWSISSSAIDIAINDIYSFIIALALTLLIISYLCAIYFTLLWNKERPLLSLFVIILMNFSLIGLLSSFILITANKGIIESLRIATELHLLLLIACLLYKTLKRFTKKDKHKASISDVFVFVIMYAFIIVLLNNNSYSNEKNRKDFKMIDNSWLVAYENDEQYYLVSYNTASSIINVNKQKIVSKDDIEYELVVIDNYIIEQVNK